MSKMRDKEYDKEVAAALEDLKRKSHEYLGLTPEEATERIIEMEIEKIVEVDNPEHLETIKELQEALANALNEEQAIKKECADCKKQLDAYIRENAKLSADNIKLKEAIKKLTESS